MGEYARQGVHTALTNSKRTKADQSNWMEGFRIVDTIFTKVTQIQKIHMNLIWHFCSFEDTGIETRREFVEKQRKECEYLDEDIRSLKRTMLEQILNFQTDTVPPAEVTEIEPSTSECNFQNEVKQDNDVDSIDENVMFTFISPDNSENSEKQSDPLNSQSPIAVFEDGNLWFGQDENRFPQSDEFAVKIKNEPLDTCTSSTNREDSQMVSYESIPETSYDARKQRTVDNIEFIKCNNESDCETYNSPNILHCESCEKIFARRRSLINHIRRCHGGKHHTCEICEMKFPHKCNLVRHLRIHNKKAFNCKTCKKNFYTNDELTAHINRLHNIEQALDICKICGRRFKTSENLNEHLTRMHNKTCKICGNFFKYSYSLKKHMESHNTEMHPCEVCGAKFRYLKSLNNHMRKHNNELPYKCKICEKQLMSKKHLLWHLRIHDDKKHKCKVCGKYFKEIPNLVKHERIHSGEKPYKCEICEKRFRVNASLGSHMLTHTGEKSYECEICKKRFKFRTSFTRHVQLHDGQKPFTCEICGRTFSRKTGIISHVQSHMKCEQHYECAMCEKKFLVRIDLVNHVAVHGLGY